MQNEPATRDDQFRSAPFKRQVTGDPRWQYSLRGLLILVTIASITLAMGVLIPGFLIEVVLVVCGLLYVAALMAGDLAIRPGYRRMLAWWTAASWAILGGALLIIAHRMASGWKIPFGLSIAAAFCFVIGLHRWRQLAGRGRAAT